MGNCELLAAVEAQGPGRGVGRDVIHDVIGRHHHRGPGGDAGAAAEVFGKRLDAVAQFRERAVGPAERPQAVVAVRKVGDFHDDKKFARRGSAHERRQVEPVAVAVESHDRLAVGDIGNERRTRVGIGLRGVLLRAALVIPRRDRTVGVRLDAHVGPQPEALAVGGNAGRGSWQSDRNQ